MGEWTHLYVVCPRMYAASCAQFYPVYDWAEMDCRLGAVYMRSLSASDRIGDIMLSFYLGSDICNGYQPYLLWCRRPTDLRLPEERASANDAAPGPSVSRTVKEAAY
jgi:hypothetical protein